MTSSLVLDVVGRAARSCNVAAMTSLNGRGKSAPRFFEEKELIKSTLFGNAAGFLYSRTLVLLPSVRVFVLGYAA